MHPPIEPARRNELSRRSFLLNGIRVSALSVVPSEWIANRPTPGSRRPRALVVVQLTGGNDGLNTVVPYEQDAYYRQRPTLALGRDELHELGGGLGFHPGLQGLAQLWSDGRVALVHGVASPLPDRSHFRSLEVWHTAEPFAPAGRVGWLGRLADQIEHAHGMPALALGEGELPLSMRGRRTVAPTVREADGFRLAELDAPYEAARLALLGNERHGDRAFLADAARSTYAAVQRMAELEAEPSLVEYPGHALARELGLAARLIDGGFGARIFHLQLDGFDTHARQASAHRGLLGRLSSALLAFQRDLEARAIADDVLTLVFSEFGRRVRENGSMGTDHGLGAPLFVIGTRVRAGHHGSAPDLQRLVDGDVAGTTDFRAVYSALEADWMELEPGTSVPPLGIV